MTENTNPKRSIGSKIIMALVIVSLLTMPVIQPVGASSHCFPNGEKFLTGVTGITESEIVCSEKQTYENSVSIKIPPLDDGGTTTGDNWAGHTKQLEANASSYNFTSTMYSNGNNNAMIGHVFNYEDSQNFEAIVFRTDNNLLIYDVNNGNGNVIDSRDAFGGFPDSTWVDMYVEIDNGANTAYVNLTNADTGNVVWEYSNLAIDGQNPTNVTGPTMGAVGTSGRNLYIQSDSVITKNTISGVVIDKEGNRIPNATVKTDSGITQETDAQGEYSFEVVDGTYNITANKINYEPQSKTVQISDSTTVNFALKKIESNLEITETNFLRPNKTTNYRIMYTNDSGVYDVTDYASIQSANSSLLSIDKTNQTIIAGSQNATVGVTANYTTDTINTSVTKTYYISYLKLSNIDTVPPAKWIQGFLGFDDGYAEDKNMKGIGSEIQWLLFVVLLMSTVAKTFDNPWAGISTGIVTGILLWVLEYIGLGLLLSMVFFGIFISLILVRVRRDGGNEVTINES